MTNSHYLAPTITHHTSVVQRRTNQVLAAEDDHTVSERKGHLTLNKKGPLLRPSQWAKQSMPTISACRMYLLSVLTGLTDQRWLYIPSIVSYPTSFPVFEVGTEGLYQRWV